MIFTKKSEGKNSLPGHPQKSKHPLRPAKKPTPDGILEIDLNATRETTLTFVEDYSIEHSSSGASADSICISVNSYSAAAPTGGQQFARVKQKPVSFPTAACAISPVSLSQPQDPWLIPPLADGAIEVKAGKSCPYQKIPILFQPVEGLHPSLVSPVAPEVCSLPLPTRIAVVGNYLPRQCGIATFTTDLCTALAAEYGGERLFAIPVNDPDSSYEYPERVRLELEQEDLPSYERAADFLNFNGNDLVCLQHDTASMAGSRVAIFSPCCANCRCRWSRRFTQCCATRIRISALYLKKLRDFQIAWLS